MGILLMAAAFLAAVAIGAMEAIRAIREEERDG